MMKCPKCGSEKTSFVSHSDTSRGSFFNGCCGYILLGPIGILCGLCGKTTEVEEYWVCNDCGNEFSTNKALSVQEKAKLAEEKKIVDTKTYEENKVIRDKAIKDFGSETKLEALTENARKQKEDKNKEYKLALKEFINNSTDENVKKAVKEKRIHQIPVIIFVAFIVFAIFFMLAGVDDLFSIFAILSLVMMFYVVNRKEKPIQDNIDNLFCESSENALVLYSDMKELNTKYKVLYGKLEKVRACREYEEKYGTK